MSSRSPVDYVIAPSSEDNPCPAFLCLTRASGNLSNGKAKTDEERKKEKEEQDRKALQVIANHDGRMGLPALDVIAKINRSAPWIYAIINHRLIDAYKLGNTLFVYEDEVVAIIEAKEKEKAHGKRNYSRSGKTKRSGSPDPRVGAHDCGLANS